MTKPAAISGTFSDYRLVKSRSVLQLVVEVPVEQQAAAFAALGYPEPGKEIHVALARIVIGDDAILKAQERSHEAHRHAYAASTPGEKARTRASLLSKDDQFRAWLAHKLGRSLDDMREGDAAEYIRSVCNVMSRREIATDPQALKAFLAMETEYRLDVRLMAEPR